MTGKPQRFSLRLALAMSFVAMQVASAAPCMTSREKLAFEIREMQSMLMIVALHCHDEGYSSFMKRHEAKAIAAYAQIGSYFARTNKTSGETERDQYITELANVHEQSSLGRTNDCVILHGFVTASLAVQTDGDMEDVLVRQGTDINRFRVCPDETAAALTAAAKAPMRVTQAPTRERLK